MTIWGKRKKIFSFAIILSFIFSHFFVCPVEAARMENDIKAQTVEINSPHKNYTYNHKGNLHAHSTNSDGDDVPATVGAWYQSNGYDFYGITDHDFVTPDPSVAGITFIGSAEEDSSDGSSGHMNHINISSAIITGTDQERINNTISQEGKTILNHIDRGSGGWEQTEIEALSDILAVEIYNGKANLNSTGTWDNILTSGRILWGTANDDAHVAAQRGTAYLVVNSENASPTENDILTQMEAGNFYASRGVDLSVSVVGGTITATTTNGNKIRWIEREGNVIKTTAGLNDTYVPSGDETYIRVEILDNSNVPKAWSQPIAIYPTASCTNDLVNYLNPSTNPSGHQNYSYWWDYAVPNSAVNKTMLFTGAVLASPKIYSMFWDQAVPHLWTNGFYYVYLFDTAIPDKIASSFYFDRFWNKAVPNLWDNQFYYQKLWDKAVPNNWVGSSPNSYKTIFWDYATPDLWANNHYYSRLWDKAVPNNWGSAYSDSYRETFWLSAVPSGWVTGYYEIRFWDKAVPNMWVSGYYSNTLNNEAIPNNWASGYYASH